MTTYAFLTRWRIAAPVERVWEEIFHVERWTRWWRGLLRVEELVPGGADQVGRVCRLTWKGWLPYYLVVEMRTLRVQAPSLLESEARGALEGLGRWRISTGEGRTHVDYEWRVRTTERWMNRLSPLARPLFVWNHHVVMRRGEQGLRRWIAQVGRHA